MDRIKSLNRFQQGLIIIMLVMTLVFSVLYPLTISRVGFFYNNTIFIPHEDNGSIVYTAKLNRKPASFTVDADKAVIFRYADQSYGPYTAIDAPDAIPADRYQGSSIKGVELRCGDEVIFRGSVLVLGGFYLLESSDSTTFHASFIDSNGIERDENGNEIDSMKPDAASILQLISGPLLTNKGNWAGFLIALFACILNVFSILYAEELFRWNISFRIQNPEHAEPSEWEMTSRYLSWIVLAVLALILFITGLQ